MITALNKKTNEVLGFPDGMSQDAIDSAIQSDKIGRPDNDVNPNTYDTVIRPALKEASTKNDPNILYNARVKQLQVDPFLSTLFNPFGLAKSSDPNIQEEQKLNVQAHPDQAMVGSLVQQLATISAVAAVAGPAVEPMAAKLGMLATDATPLAIRTATIGSGEILPKLAGEAIQKTVTSAASAGMVGALYQGISTSVEQGKGMIDNKQYPDLLKIGTSMAKGLDWAVYGSGGAFTEGMMGISAASATVGGTAYLMSKMDGASETDARLNGVLMTAFTAITHGNFNFESRKKLVSDLRDTYAGYTKAKNPDSEQNNIHQLVGDEIVGKTAKDLLTDKYKEQIKYYNKSMLELHPPPEPQIFNSGEPSPPLTSQQIEDRINLHNKPITDSPGKMRDWLLRYFPEDYLTKMNNTDVAALFESPVTDIRSYVNDLRNQIEKTKMERISEHGIGEDMLEESRIDWLRNEDVGEGGLLERLENMSGQDAINEVIKNQPDTEELVKRLADQAFGGNNKISSPKEKIGSPNLKDKVNLNELSDRTKDQVGVEEKGTSKIAKSIETKAKDEGLTKGFSALGKYRKTTFEEQEKLAKDVMKNPEDARAMIRGEKELPKDLEGVALIDQMEEHLKTIKDKSLKEEIAYELANSPLVTETSEQARGLSVARMREQDSFAKTISELKSKKLQMSKQVAKEIPKKAREAMSKINLSKEEMNLDKFLDDIKC